MANINEITDFNNDNLINNLEYPDDNININDLNNPMNNLMNNPMNNPMNDPMNNPMNDPMNNPMNNYCPPGNYFYLNMIDNINKIHFLNLINLYQKYAKFKISLMIF